jgi:hypothetical protein
VREVGADGLVRGDGLVDQGPGFRAQVRQPTGEMDPAQEGVGQGEGDLVE